MLTKQFARQVGEKPGPGECLGRSPAFSPPRSLPLGQHTLAGLQLPHVQTMGAKGPPRLPAGRNKLVADAIW